eukprot:TRINITY_DN32217_c1_g1_i2.p1 TRINITY_DN32217_c1_g1~~TRINITY_DN32217_c1_g1_i2.p1  ORF type:complete len:466 (+),score=25.36 TRINITY_DN32217_c1_g1_i2:170-1567(+)
MFPKDFQKGVAISVWQNAPDSHSNWTKFCKGKKFGCIPNVFDRSDPNVQSDFWNNYERDIQCARELGCNAFRFSFEWSRIEPIQGEIDEAALIRYHDIIRYMKSLGIEPNATLHHFVHPAWFDDLGGFLKEENIKLFVEYSERVFKEFQSEIRLWCTFNEPTVYSFCGFVVGIHCPGRMFQFRNCGKNLLNMLRAHTQTYRKLKSLPGGDTACIGLVHHFTYAIPYSNNCFYALSKWICKYVTHWLGWDIVPEYLEKGKFNWKVPIVLFGGGVKYQEKGDWDKPPIDWFGVNYYSRGVVGLFLLPVTLKGEVQTDMGYSIYADGLYESIRKVSSLGCPIYITETGVADRKDTMRKLWIQSYTDQIWRAIQDGLDVRGLYYWTLVDNFEWQAGFTTRFGLFQWEPDGSVDRKLREGSKTLQTIYKLVPSNLQELKRWIQEKFKKSGEKQQDQEILLNGVEPKLQFT